MSSKGKVHGTDDQTISTKDDANASPQELMMLTLDLDSDESEALKRYETVYQAFLLHGLFAPLTAPLTLKTRVHGTLVDYCVSHALQGSSYIDETQMGMQYTVLQSALILTISMPLYIEPPSFDSDDITRVFSAIIGLAAITQLIVIIACTIISAALNQPSSAADTVVVRAKARKLIYCANFFNYIANIATLAAVLIAGFARNFIDGVVQIYAGVLALILLYMYFSTRRLGVTMQDMRTLAFYRKYCALSGRLKPEYLKMVYYPDSTTGSKDTCLAQVFKEAE